MIEIDVSVALQDLHFIARKIHANVYEDFETFFAEATLAFHETPRYIREAVNALVRGYDHDGLLIIRGLPLDSDLPPTPIAPNAKISKATYISELWLCCVASMLGEPVAYLQEKGGSIFHNIYPTSVNASNLSSESSSITLDFHTEMAFHPFLPDYVLLYGLRQDPEKVAMTSVSSISRILPMFTSEQRRVLFEQQFKTGIDYSFGSSNGTKANGPLISILYGNQDSPLLKCDPDLVIGLTPTANRVLKELEAMVDHTKIDIMIEPGTMLVMDNRRCVHARSKFTAHYDGKDRWLQRMLVIQNLAFSAQDREPGSRVITTDFSHYFAK